MRKRQRDEQGVGAPDGQLKKQRASEESPSPSPSPSTGSQKIASSGSANESSSSAGQSMQVDPAQAPPRRGLHGRNWDLLSTCGLLAKKPVLPSTSQADTCSSTSTPANASTVDTTRPEQLQASVARLNQRNYMSRSSQGQAEGSSSHATSSSDPNAQSSSSHATAASENATASLPFSITVGDLLHIQLSEQQDSSEAYATAFHGLQKSSFNESIDNCKRELMRHKLGVCSGTLSDVLNGTSAAHGLTIKHNGTTVKHNGHLLLLCMCHAFNIKAYVFSTRKHAVIVSPSSEPAASTVALLVHTDSYSQQRTTWHTLTYGQGYTTPKPLV